MWIMQKKFTQLLENHDISGLIDERNEKTGKKIRDAEIKKLPFMLIVGENEEANGTVSVRRRGEGDLGAMSVEDFINYFKKHSAISNHLSAN
jgi:threonyl-tRNA synthetase (EC 6.1.1.3)/Ser-tRNA(Thr) hydrolase (EC 3.1.1.-)